MSEARSVHDNQIIGYDVDCEHRRILLRTRFAGSLSTPVIEQTNIIFHGVEAYHVTGDNFGNIIASLDEIPLGKLVRDNAKLFEDERKYGWPGPWNQSPDAVLNHFEMKGLTAFVLSSSYGMAGWFVAESCRIEAADEARSNGSNIAQFK